MAPKRRFLAALLAAALVTVGLVGGAAANGSASSNPDTAVVTAAGYHPHGCGGCGNGGS